MMHNPTTEHAPGNDFLDLTVEVGALTDLADDHDLAGPSGPDDDCLVLGQSWATYLFAVRPARAEAWDSGLF